MHQLPYFPNSSVHITEIFTLQQVSNNMHLKSDNIYKGASAFSKIYQIRKNALQDMIHIRESEHARR